MGGRGTFGRRLPVVYIELSIEKSENDTLYPTFNVRGIGTCDASMDDAGMMKTE
jgi:hypothetical protein